MFPQASFGPQCRTFFTPYRMCGSSTNKNTEHTAKSTVDDKRTTTGCNFIGAELIKLWLRTIRAVHLSSFVISPSVRCKTIMQQTYSSPTVECSWKAVHLFFYQLHQKIWGQDAMRSRLAQKSTVHFSFSRCMVAHACHSKKFLFVAFFWKKKQKT